MTPHIWPGSYLRTISRVSTSSGIAASIESGSFGIFFFQSQCPKYRLVRFLRSPSMRLNSTHYTHTFGSYEVPASSYTKDSRVPEALLRAVSPPSRPLSPPDLAFWYCHLKTDTDTGGENSNSTLAYFCRFAFDSTRISAPRGPAYSPSRPPLLSAK